MGQGIINTYSKSLDNKFTGADYYLIAAVNNDQNSILGIFSDWIGFTDDKMRQEMKIEHCNAR